VDIWSALYSSIEHVKRISLALKLRPQVQTRILGHIENYCQYNDNNCSQFLLGNRGDQWGVVSLYILFYILVIRTSHHSYLGHLIIHLQMHVLDAGIETF
jgi:hypothetical protein